MSGSAIIGRMSYDLVAFRVPPGMTAEEAYESGAADEDEGLAAPTADERAAMERLADALMELDPEAERADDRLFIEIDAEPIQLLLHAREAQITMPYWFSGPEADAVMDRAFAYARVLSEVGGYAVYDPQTEQVVEAGADRADASRVYSGTSARLDELVTDDQRPQREPWWRLWRRRW
jgi:hypothetical protein